MPDEKSLVPRTYIAQPQAMAERDFNTLDEMIDAYLSEGVINPQERELLRILIDPDARLDVIVPEKPSPEQVWEQLGICCRVHNTLVRSTYAIKPIIGRLLLVIQDNPEMYEDKGYKNFTEFLIRWVPQNLYVSRSEAWKIRCVAEQYPSLTPRKILEIGYTKLVCMSKFVDEKHPAFERLCGVAPTMSVDDFAKVVIQEAKRDYAENAPVNTVIKSTIAIDEMWRDFKSNKFVQAECGTKDPKIIFMRMIEECSGEWIDRGRERIQRERQEQRENLMQVKLSKAAARQSNTDLGGIAAELQAAIEVEVEGEVE